MLAGEEEMGRDGLACAKSGRLEVTAEGQKNSVWLGKCLEMRGGAGQGMRLREEKCHVQGCAAIKG